MRITAIIVLIAVALFIGCADRNDPVTPIEDSFVLISQTQTPGWAKDVFLNNDTVFVADDEVGISIYDVSSPGSPQFVQTLQVGEPAYSVTVTNADNYALLVALTKYGIRFFKYGTDTLKGSFGSSGISDFQVTEKGPDSLILVSTDAGDGLGMLKFFYNTFWDVWQNQETFQTADVSSYRGVLYNDDYIYLAHSQIGLDIIEVDFTPDGNFPVALIGTTDTPGSAYDLAGTEFGNIVVVADYQSGIQIVDVTDKTNPTIIGSVSPDDADRVVTVKVKDSIAYFIDEYNALYAADISDPTNPQLIGIYKSPEPSGVFVADDKTVYLTDIENGLSILQWR